MTIGSALTGSYQHSPTRLARLSCVLLTQQDIYHFREGTYVRAYQKLGAHAVRAADGTVGGTRRAGIPRGSGKAWLRAWVPARSTSTTSPPATGATGSTRAIRTHSAPRCRRAPPRSCGT